MDNADIDKLYDALKLTHNLAAQSTNLSSRGPLAIKVWSTWLKTNPYALGNKQAAAHMKAGLVALTKLAKEGKTIQKDLDKAALAASRKNLAKYKTGKEYRDKVLVKAHASAKKYDQTCAAFLESMSKVVDGFEFAQATQAGIDDKASIGYAKAYRQYYKDMQDGLKKLG